VRALEWLYDSVFWIFYNENVSFVPIHGFGLSRRGGVFSTFGGFSRAYVLKIRPLAEFLEGGLLEILVTEPTLNQCMFVPLHVGYALINLEHPSDYYLTNI
jgi:hypothetical protein